MRARTLYTYIFNVFICVFLSSSNKRPATSNVAKCAEGSINITLEESYLNSTQVALASCTARDQCNIAPLLMSPHHRCCCCCCCCISYDFGISHRICVECVFCRCCRCCCCFCRCCGRIYQCKAILLATCARKSCFIGRARR